ncbi:2OG-Fe(II) oxygenase [Gammaproteobacteria bacterium]
MKKFLETGHLVIYDDFLDKIQFERIWQAIQTEEYSIIHIQKWLKIWRISDGLPMFSKLYVDKEFPFNNYMDLMNTSFKESAENHPNIVGNWKNIGLRSYLYNRDTKLSWHNDKGYTAAGIFYVHPYWGSTWGGELMIAQTPEAESIPNPALEHTFEDKFFEYYGCGQYITAKPNRLILLKSGVWHSINRVDKDAGDHVRCSVVAFFTS